MLAEGFSDGPRCLYFPSRSDHNDMLVSTLTGMLMPDSSFSDLVVLFVLDVRSQVRGHNTRSQG